MNSHRTTRFTTGLILLFFLVQPVLAQQLISERANIMMINGNHITGQLFYNRDDSSFTIRPANEIMLRLPSNIIKSINFNYNQREGVRNSKNARFYNNTTFGLAIGKNTESVGGAGNITAEMVNGLMFKPWLQIGLGIGYDQYDMSAVVPYFISISGNILNHSFTPYYFLEAGTSAAWAYKSSDPYYYYSPYSEADGKSMINFGIGYRIYIEKNLNFGFTIGYRIQKVVYGYDYGYESAVSDITYRRILLKLGIGF
jgi:hypothetical protein